MGHRVRSAKLGHYQNGNFPHTDGLPSWVLNSVFDSSRCIAWEGEANPLTASKIFPADSSLAALITDNGARPWFEAIHALDQRRVQDYFAALASSSPRTDRDEVSKSRNVRSIEYRILTTDGELMWVRHNIISLEYINNRLSIRSFVFNIDNEKQFHLESLRISEREQKRIGQDLHDDICQILTGVSCLIQVSAAKLSAKAPAESAQLVEINARVIDAMNRARSICHGLHLVQENNEGLISSLKDVATQSRTRFGIQVQERFSQKSPRRSPVHTQEQLMLVTRIMQEAICNAVRHGEASEVTLRLELLSKGIVRLSLSDNGRGLSRKRGKPEGIGMHLMRYRTALLGGTLTLRPKSKTQRGALLQLTYSLAKDN